MTRLRLESDETCTEQRHLWPPFRQVEGASCCCGKRYLLRDLDGRFYEREVEDAALRAQGRDLPGALRGP